MGDEHTIQDTIKELEMLVEDYDIAKVTSSEGREFATLLIRKEEADNYRRLIELLRGML